MAINCKGSWQLGNNCGVCEQCIKTKPKVVKTNSLESTDIIAMFDELNDFLINEKQLGNI
jgi:hypothetical protein